jgi:hypothetical protein
MLVIPPSLPSACCALAGGASCLVARPHAAASTRPHVSESALRDMGRRPGWSVLVALRDRRTCAFAPAAYDVLVRPGPRLGEGADIGAAVAYLASREAGYVTGQTIHVNGGMAML